MASKMKSQQGTGIIIRYHQRPSAQLMGCKIPGSLVIWVLGPSGLCSEFRTTKTCPRKDLAAKV